MSYAKSVIEVLNIIKPNTLCKIIIDEKEAQIERFLSYNPTKRLIRTKNRCNDEENVYKVDDIKSIEFQSEITRNELGAAIRKKRESAVINTIGMKTVNGR